MEIRFLGHASFLLRSRKLSIVTDPFDPSMVGIPFPKVKADVVTISHQHQDHNQATLVKEVKKVIDGPGHYEIQGVDIIGYQTFHDTKKGGERGLNTIYKIKMDNFSLLHLGDLGHILSDELIEEIGEVDLLFIPVGGYYTIGYKEAIEIVQKIEPLYIFPMHFNLPNINKEIFGRLDTEKNFVEQLGLPVERLDKFTIDSESKGEEQKVYLLSCP